MAYFTLPKYIHLPRIIFLKEIVLFLAMICRRNNRVFGDRKPPQRLWKYAVRATLMPTLNQMWNNLMSTERASAFVSDVVRSELLRRYGGTYLDLDFITLHPLPLQPLVSSSYNVQHSQTHQHRGTKNWLAWADHRLINLAISSFTKGHWLMEVCFYMVNALRLYAIFRL